MAKQPLAPLEPLADALPPLDSRRVIRQGLALLLLGLGGFVLWALLVPLDEGVPAPAVVVVEARSTQIQHHAVGQVAEVTVREGQRVAAGDVLIRLVSLDSQAQLDESRMLWAALAAREARWAAEITGSAQLAWPASLQALRGEAAIQAQMTNQEALLRHRRAALAAELEALRKQMAETQATLDATRQSLALRKEQAGLLEQELRGVRDMVAGGFLARSQQLDLERRTVDLRATVAELEGGLQRLGEALAESQSRIRQREAAYRQEVEGQLADTRRDLATQAERLKVASESRARTDIRAPVAGAVVGLAGLNAGSVVSPGARLLEIVPERAALTLEAQVPVHLVDRLVPGQAVDVHLSGFVQLPQLTLPGRLATVSAGALSDPVTRVSYYLARVDILPEGLARMGVQTLQPGMPAQVLIKTGERTLFHYLMRPLQRRITESLKEP